ncbi:hypothetical protein LMH87_002259 [Akanthomyces muscarius]|uniref:Uncharacterized protein n=1 Tax=Akanthomyces muscarius TaxID=2231603 RepID=A0A9W8Q859_AKAMU|nr:hypothetical protein LMH87_002259 [Akanthomyces muscarius]KAJ4147753.1 hypothetical protein LMH87_002259 [Akanthomyces muscarius]
MAARHLALKAKENPRHTPCLDTDRHTKKLVIDSRSAYNENRTSISTMLRANCTREHATNVELSWSEGDVSSAHLASYDLGLPSALSAHPPWRKPLAYIPQKNRKVHQ